MSKQIPIVISIGSFLDSLTLVVGSANVLLLYGMIVTKHDVTSEYLSQVAGYIPLMWDIFLDTYRFKRERYKRVCLSSIQRIPFWCDLCWHQRSLGSKLCVRPRSLISYIGIRERKSINKVALRGNLPIKLWCQITTWIDHVKSREISMKSVTEQICPGQTNVVCVASSPLQMKHYRAGIDIWFDIRISNQIFGTEYIHIHLPEYSLDKWSLKYSRSEYFSSLI